MIEIIPEFKGIGFSKLKLAVPFFSHASPLKF